jgi:membrane-associated phospholipid phosphatase
LIIIPFIYWTVNKRLGIRLLFILLITHFITSTFKLLFHQPRPYWLGKVMGLAEEPTYGLPSSHASDSLAVWGYLAYRLKKTWLTVLVVIFVFFIGFSRLYLGVHFPHDVLFGWLIGAFVLWVFVKFEDRVAAWLNGQTVSMQIGAGFLFSLVVILVGALVQVWLSGITDPPEWSSFSTQARTPNDFYTLAGSLFGALCGYVLMKRLAPFETSGSALQQLARYILGIIGLLVIYTGMDILFGMIAPDETALGYTLRYLRYATATFFVAFLAPWIFLKIGLAKREIAQPVEVISPATPSGQNV